VCDVVLLAEALQVVAGLPRQQRDDRLQLQPFEKLKVALLRVGAAIEPLLDDGKPEGWDEGPLLWASYALGV